MNLEANDKLLASQQLFLKTDKAGDFHARFLSFTVSESGFIRMEGQGDENSTLVFFLTSKPELHKDLKLSYNGVGDIHGWYVDRNGLFWEPVDGSITFDSFNAEEGKAIFSFRFTGHPGNEDQEDFKAVGGGHFNALTKPNVPHSFHHK